MNHPQPHKLPPLDLGGVERRHLFCDWWQITTIFAGRAVSSLFEPRAWLAPLLEGRMDDEGVAFDSATHEIIDFWHELWPTTGSRERLVKRFRRQPDRYWWLPRWDDSDLFAHLREFVSNMDESDEKKRLAEAVWGRRPFSNFIESASKSVYFRWGYARDTEFFVRLANFFRHHGVGPDPHSEGAP